VNLELHQWRITTGNRGNDPHGRIVGVPSLSPRRGGVLQGMGWALYVNLTAPCQLMGLPVTCQDHPSLERSAVNLHRGDKSVFIKDAGSESLVDTRASSTGWWRKD